MTIREVNSYLGMCFLFAVGVALLYFAEGMGW